MFNLSSTVAQASSIVTMNYFKAVVSEGPIKFFACVGTSILSAISTFFLPIWVTILAVCILTLIDMLLGIRVSVLRKKPLQSRLAWRTLKKFGWSTMIISCAHLVDTYILVSFNAHLVEAFAGMIGGVELWSIVENLQTIDPDGPWRVFGKFIKQKGEKYLDITIDKSDLPKVKNLVKNYK